MEEKSRIVRKRKRKNTLCLTSPGLCHEVWMNPKTCTASHTNKSTNITTREAACIVTISYLKDTYTSINISGSLMPIEYKFIDSSKRNHIIF